MAYLWIEKGKTTQWLTVELTGDVWVLSTGEPMALDKWHCGGSVSRPTLLVRRGDPTDAQWVLLAGHEANVRVNGLPMGLASRVLQDHDEILLGDAETDSWRRCFFSRAGAVSVEPFPVNDNPMCCPHCKHPILGGQPAVRCPACGQWHHEMSDGQCCWSLPGCCGGCHCRAPLDNSTDNPQAE